MIQIRPFKRVFSAILLTSMISAGAAAGVNAQGMSAGESERGSDREGFWQHFTRPSDKELRKQLDALQYRVTQENGTEPPFQNIFWDNHKEGIYVDIVSGEPLFSSRDKFDSGTGWPSFTQPLCAEHIVEHEDNNLGVSRVEVRSKLADSHLGHVFEVGPEPTGLRYCINSAALRFIPVDHLQEKGYGDFLGLFRTAKMIEEAKKDPYETATFAGGCFWGMEDILRDISGVVDTDVGYASSRVQNPGYGAVGSGLEGHAEAVRVVFDSRKISYEELLSYYFRMHDPTTKNRQGNDIGTQYRSAIFNHGERQREIAERVKEKVNRSGKWKASIVTEIVPINVFFRAEEYHQDYLEKHPNGYTCHYLREWD